MSEYSLIPRGRDVVLMALAAVLVLTAVPAGAIDLGPSSGKYRLNLDTTLSWGARYRMQERDLSIISPFEGGTAWSVNGDDGNLNFDKGSLVSNALKATVDLDFATRAGQHDFGFFARGSAFYDFALMNDCCERTELTDEALDWAGNRVELLDAYAWWRFPLGNGGGQLRLGRQVLNWGESTFIQGGIGITNPVDVSALRVPGAELREAYRPVGMLWGSSTSVPNFRSRPTISSSGRRRSSILRAPISPPTTSLVGAAKPSSSVSPPLRTPENRRGHGTRGQRIIPLWGSPGRQTAIPTTVASTVSP